MKIRPMPAHVLHAMIVLFEPYCKGLTPRTLVAALSDYEDRPPEVEHPMMSREDLCESLNLSLPTLARMQNDIPHYKIGRLVRFKRHEVDAFIEEARR